MGFLSTAAGVIGKAVGGSVGQIVSGIVNGDSFSTIANNVGKGIVNTLINMSNPLRLVNSVGSFITSLLHRHDKNYVPAGGIDVIVDDAYMKEAGVFLNQYCSEMNALITEFNSQLNGAAAEGLVEGAAHDKLAVLALSAQKFQNVYDSVGAFAQCTTETFATAIDDADQYIY